MDKVFTFSSDPLQNNNFYLGDKTINDFFHHPFHCFTFLVSDSIFYQYHRWRVSWTRIPRRSLRLQVFSKNLWQLTTLTELLVNISTGPGILCTDQQHGNDCWYKCNDWSSCNCLVAGGLRINEYSPELKYLWEHRITFYHRMKVKFSLCAPWNLTVQSSSDMYRMHPPWLS